MDTIMSYLETMFARLPQTGEIEQIFQDLQLNMEDKYRALIAEGKTENEAVGTVITEFGNIDELVQELGYGTDEEGEMVRELSDQEIDDFLVENKRSGKWTGIGVGLILLGVASMVAISSLTRLLDYSNRVLDVVGLIPLLVFIAIAVGMFMISSHRMERFKTHFVNYRLTRNQEHTLDSRLSNTQPAYIRNNVIGVFLCILAPLALIIISVIDENYAGIGVSLLLILIAVAVFLFVYNGKQKSAYEKLLKNEDYNSEINLEEDRLIGAVSAFVWPLAVAVFLITGFIFDYWHINWIIFPITGLLFAAFSGMRSVLNEKDK